MTIFSLKEKNREVQYKNMSESLGGYQAKPLPDDALKSSRMRSVVNSYHIMETYKNKSKVAFAVEQGPNELLYAFKIIAFNIQILPAIYTGADKIQKYLRLSDENNLSRDLCSNIRSEFGVAIANCYPSPDIIMVSNHPCNVYSKLTNIISKFYNCKFFCLDVPNYLNNDSVSYLTRQLKRFVFEIENELNIRYKEEEFKKVVEYSNEAREYYCKTTKLLQSAYNLPYVPRELYEIFSLNAWGLKETIDICKTLYEETSTMHRLATAKQNKKRVLWVGQLPYHNHSAQLLSYIEERIELLHWGSLLEANEVMLDTRDPLKSIAERTIMFMWNPYDMRENMIDICKRFNIKGVILQNPWGCRNQLTMNQMLREMIAENDIKYVTIDGDYMNQDNVSYAQVKNRIDAFLELL